MPGRVTVFGGTGYLGRAIVRHLLVAGAGRIRIAVRHPEQAEAMAHALGGVEPVEADVNRRETVARALENADAAVNAVSLYVPRPGLGFEDVHVAGARHVAEAARACGAGLVHISGVGADAGSPQRYIRARGRGEAAVRAAHAGAIVVRPTILFSAGGGLIDQILRVLRASPVFPLFGRGAMRLQPVHRDDVAEAVARLLGRAGICRRVCECGGPEVETYRTIVHRIAGAAGHPARLVPVPFPLWQVATGPHPVRLVLSERLELRLVLRSEREHALHVPVRFRKKVVWLAASITNLFCISLTRATSSASAASMTWIR